MLPPKFRPFRRTPRAPLFAAINIALLMAGGSLLARPAHADSWALLIGIDQYEDGDNIAHLGGADNDANALAKTLIESAGFPAAHVHILTSSGVGVLKPSRHNILHELEVLRSRVRPGDTVFVAYSGHGVDSGGVPYLLPYDADITTPALIRDSSIPEEKFREYLKSVPAKALILVFDMCRVNADKSGKAGATDDAHLTDAQVRGFDFSSVVTSGGAAAAASPAPTDHPQIVAEFFACSPNFRSYEWRAKERGYFSWFLEQGLRGQAASASPAEGGGVSLDALKRYLATAVPAAVRDNELGKEQTPTGDIIGPLDAGDFILARASVPEPGAPAPVANVVNTHARLKITVNAPNPVITVDGQPLASGADYVANLLTEEKRMVKVVVTAPGYDGQALDVELHKGVSAPLAITLTALLPAPVAPVAPAIAAAATPTAPVVPAVVAAAATDLTSHVQPGTLTGHASFVNAASFSLDGQYIVTACRDAIVRIWDTANGHLVRTLTADGFAGWYVASFSPDGKFIVTDDFTSDAVTSAKVWDAATGRLIRTLSGQQSIIVAASFSPNGKYIVTASRDDTANVWNAATGEILQVLTGHTSEVHAASFSPDSKYVVTGSFDGTARIWDASTGVVVRTFTEHDGEVNAASFSPDGKYIVTAGKKAAKIWDVATGDSIQTLNGHSGPVLAASFSPDGMYIVTGSYDGTVKVWDVATGKAGP